MLLCYCLAMKNANEIDWIHERAKNVIKRLFSSESRRMLCASCVKFCKITSEKCWWLCKKHTSSFSNLLFLYLMLRRHLNKKELSAHFNRQMIQAKRDNHLTASQQYYQKSSDCVSQIHSNESNEANRSLPDDCVYHANLLHVEC